MRKSQPVGALLAQMVAADRSDPVRPEIIALHAEDIARRAVYHGVPGVVSRRFRQLGIDPPQYLRQHERGAALTRLQTEADLAVVDRAFAASGIPYLTFKGPAISVVAYRDAAERPAADLDLLVPRSALADAIETLVADGCMLLDRNWALMRERLIGEVHMVLPGGTALDLHWHLLVNADLRRHFRPDLDEIFERARTIHIGPVQTRTMDPASTLAYQSLHAAVSGGHRLIWLKDLEQCLLNDQADPDEVAAIARQWRCQLQLGVMLERTERVLGVSSEAIVRRLGCRPVVLRTLALAERANPPSEVDDDEVLLRMITRSIGPSAGTTAWRFVRRALSFGRRRALHQEHEDPRTLFEPRGKEIDRAAFFARVASDL